MNRFAASFILALSALAVAAPVRGGDCCADRCDVCGCHCHCDKVCKLIVGTKKVPKITYCCECEDICLPGPSRRCGHNCVCDTNPCNGECKEHHPINWIPNPCGKIITLKRLVKIEETKEVPSYKWVVQHVCGNCAKCGCVAQNPAATAPAGEPAQLTGAEVEPQAPSVSETNQSVAGDDLAAPSAKANSPSPSDAVKSKLLSFWGK